MNHLVYYHAVQDNIIETWAYKDFNQFFKQGFNHKTVSDSNMHRVII